MKARGAAIQGALAVLGLATAYATWQRAPELNPGEVVVLDAGKKDIVKVRYDDGAGKWVELGPGPDKEGVWLRVGPRAEPQKTPERNLRGSEAAVRLMEKFAPLRATRALGTLAPDKLKELGLDAPKKRIEVTARGSTSVFLVGQPPAGVASPYVKDERDGRVYVLAGGVVSELDGAPGWLVERRLHGFSPTEYDGLTVAAGGKKRELVTTGGPTPAARKLAPKGAADKPDEMAKNWHEKLWHLVPTDVLGKDEAPAAGAPQVALRVDYTQKGTPVGWIELGRVTPAAPAPASAMSGVPTRPAPAPEVYARTEHTAGWIKLAGNADELLKEADKVAAAP